MQNSFPPESPGLHGRRALVTIILQLVGAVAAGAGGGYLGMEIGFRFFAGDPAGFGDIVARLGGILLGYPIGCGLGSWLVGRWRGLGSPFWASLVGAIAGVSLIFLFFILFPSGELVFGWLLIFACGAIGAVALPWLILRRKHKPGTLGASHA
ncbi:MAG: hypothetical protein AB4911_24145 [Oscillochloridaceae bacterium umkhey_bin13]